MISLELAFAALGLLAMGFGIGWLCAVCMAAGKDGKGKNGH